MKMRKTLRLATVFLAVTAMGGCKMNLTADIYSSDIRMAAAGTAGLTTPATMAFEVPSADAEECAENTAKIASIMAGVVNEFSPKGCVKRGLDSFLLADTQIPLLNSMGAWKEADSLFGMVLTAKEDKIHMAMTMDLVKYEILTRRMKDEFHQSVDLADSSITIVLNNDEAQPIRLTVNGVFVNSKPAAIDTDYELLRRHKAEIRFSNVATAYMATHGITGGIAIAAAP